MKHLLFGWRFSIRGSCRHWSIECLLQTGTVVILYCISTGMAIIFSKSRTELVISTGKVYFPVQYVNTVMWSRSITYTFWKITSIIYIYSVPAILDRLGKCRVHWTQQHMCTVELYCLQLWVPLWSWLRYVKIVCVCTF